MPDPLSAREWIRVLNLQSHPEGGWFAEVHRSGEGLAGDQLPHRYGGDRRCWSTSIYYLLERGQFSSFHRLRSEELWYHHAGGQVIIHVLQPDGAVRRMDLGRDIQRGEQLQAVVPAGRWFAAEPAAGTEFALVGCAVVPGFEFADFELARKDELIRSFPAHADLIGRLCRA